VVVESEILKLNEENDAIREDIVVVRRDITALQTDIQNYLEKLEKDPNNKFYQDEISKTRDQILKTKDEISKNKDLILKNKDQISGQKDDLRQLSRGSEAASKKSISELG